MSRTARPLVIDARPRGPAGPLAVEVVQGRPVLAHLLELAAEAGAGPVAVHARLDEHERLRALTRDAGRPEVVFATGPPPEGFPILRSDRLYDPGRLRRALRRGRDPELAVVWRLDAPESAGRMRSRLRGGPSGDGRRRGDGEEVPVAEPTISALIIAKDEAANLADCLDALDWADERVVVVDAASRDGTEAIARAKADRVIVRPFDDFASQRNAALGLVTGDWVLAVDADERATPELAAEIRRVLGNPKGRRDGYRVPIRSAVLGRPFRYSGTQHDLPLRLFRRDRGRWAGEVHETVALAGRRGTLRQPLRHRTLPDLHAFLAKLDAYTTLEARRLLREGAPFRLRDLTLRPAWIFVKLYIVKRGFLDGVEGFLFCALSAVSAAVRHAKHRELVREESTG